MGLDTGHYLQLIIALGAGITLFVGAYVLPVRVVMWILLLLIPFQLINSAYGSINLVLTYMVGAAFLLRHRFKSLPLLGTVSFIMLAYMLSFSQIPKGTTMDHGLYIIAVVSNFILFYLVYNFVRTSAGYQDMWRILAILNVLVLIYCILEVAVGTTGIRLFGIAELEIKSGRAEQGYFLGPFGSVATSAEYMAVQSLITIYAMMRAVGTRQRLFWGFLMAGNMAFLVASGSRGGVISLLIGLLVFFFLFRKELGLAKALSLIAAGSLVFSISAFVIVQYTSYNILFDKLQGTEFVDGVPESRAGWFDIWDRVVAKPVFGHGPRLRLRSEALRKIPGHVHIPYPHNAYMYLVATIGLVGLSAYMWFFFALGRQYWIGGGMTRARDPLLRGLPLLGIALLVLVAASQVRMEMFRFHLHGYQQYFFMLIGAFLAFSHLARDARNTNENTQQQEFEAPVRDNILSRANRKPR